MPSQITLTEALAELKLIKARVEKKKQFIVGFIARQELIKDPLEKQGGSVSAIRAERQSISDLLNRWVAIRSKIAAANAANTLTIRETQHTVADWLVWKRDIAPIVKDLQNAMTGQISGVRQKGLREGFKVVKDGEATQPSDIIVNVDELELSSWQERTVETLGTLDGKLSLHNATVTIEI